MREFSISTAIAYPNGEPHLGHALEFTQADFFAREAKVRDIPVYFQTGTDEHGLKIFRTAEAAAKSPQEFTDEKAEAFVKLMADLGISYDRFLRTTEPDHKAAAQALWQRVADAGYLEKRTYRAWYDVKEEEFLGPADGVDPQSFGVDEKFLELIEEENYFFKLSEFSDKVLALIESDQYLIRPAGRKLEMVNFVKKGLSDVSVSRAAEKLPWGITVPGDESQVMYVWFDALANYLTGASSVVDGQLVVNENRWPWDLHIVGKDIARFHGMLWPAMLMAADLATPKELIVHGFLLANGQKMSKSLGNGVAPSDLLDVFGADATRWMLLAHVPTLDDGNISLDRAHEIYSSDLANDYGNLVNRVTSMVKRYRDGVIPASSSNLEKMLVEEAWAAYDKAVADREIEKALNHARDLVVFANRRIEELQPWALAKDESKAGELDELLYELLEILRHVSIMTLPVMPETSSKIHQLIAPNMDISTWKSRTWAGLVSGASIAADPVILFPRIERDAD